MLTRSLVGRSFRVGMAVGFLVLSSAGQAAEISVGGVGIGGGGVSVGGGGLGGGIGGGGLGGGSLGGGIGGVSAAGGGASAAVGGVGAGIGGSSATSGGTSVGIGHDANTGSNTLARAKPASTARFRALVAKAKEMLRCKETFCSQYSRSDRDLRRLSIRQKTQLLAGCKKVLQTPRQFSRETRDVCQVVASL